MNLTKCHQQLRDRATLNILQYYGTELDWNDAFGAIHQGTKTGRISVPCISARGSWAVRVLDAFGSVSPKWLSDKEVPDVFLQHEITLTVPTSWGQIRDETRLR